MGHKPSPTLTRFERAKLVELLGRYLNEGHSREAKVIVRASGELLYTLGTHLHFHDDSFFVVSSKP